MGGARDRIVLPPVAISGEGAERLDGTKAYWRDWFLLWTDRSGKCRENYRSGIILCVLRSFLSIDSLQGRGDH